MYGPITARAAGCLLTGAAAVWLASCQSVGPTTIPRDRFDYSTAIGDSWKRQTLLNIVRLRYADPPIFVDVGQVIAGYSLETVVSAGGGVSSPGADTATLGAQGRFTDRPTITYTPLTGNRFIENIATPISPQGDLRDHRERVSRARDVADGGGFHKRAAQRRQRPRRRAAR